MQIVRFLLWKKINMKKIIITGHLGANPIGRNAERSGEYYVTFSVAVSVGTKDNPKTDWVEVSCNKKLAEIAIQYLKKGTRVLLEGFPSAGAYISKDGKATPVLKLSAGSLEILSPKDKNNDDDRYRDTSYDDIPL